MNFVAYTTFDDSSDKHPIMSIEEFQPNLKSYRVLVFNNKVIGVVERIPAHVIGDGVHTLNELIQMTNAERKLLEHELSVGSIEMAEELSVKLMEMGLTFDDIPKKGESVQLCYKCNSAVGGTMRTADHEICQENITLALKAARVLNLNQVGFDILCEDIGKPIGKTRGYFIEANYNPDVTIHENPIEGVKNLVTRKILWGLIKRHPLAYVWQKIKVYREPILFYFKIILVVTSVFIYQHMIA